MLLLPNPAHHWVAKAHFFFCFVFKEHKREGVQAFIKYKEQERGEWGCVYAYVCSLS